MTSYNEIFDRNKQWVTLQNETDAEFFGRLVQGQAPDYLYIGCADSRVPANQIMGLDAGEVFVQRNIANMVLHTDLNCQSVIEYAVVHLRVKHIIVCGHYGCGGVKAAMNRGDLGILNPWLRNIRDVYRKHQIELSDIASEEVRFNRFVELNVLEQCLNVTKVASVLKGYEVDRYPVVHGLVFDMRNGLLMDLNFDFHGTVQKVMEVYHL